MILQCFYIKKTFLKKQIYTSVSSQLEMGKTNFSMHFDTVAIYLTVLEKEQHKKIYIYI